jgi:hypothetical protein
LYGGRADEQDLNSKQEKVKMNQEIPPPICEICGTKQIDGDNINVIFYTHYGVFCDVCYLRYEWRFKEVTGKVCKKQIKFIKRLTQRSNWFGNFLGLFKI